MVAPLGACSVADTSRRSEGGDDMVTLCGIFYLPLSIVLNASLALPCSGLRRLS